MGLISDLAVKLATRQAEEAAAKKAAMRAAEEAVAPRMAVKALPAPPKRLALPAPKPKPDPRFKPRGGQWMPDATVSFGPRHAINHSPENAVYREALGVANNDQSNWLQKALLKYYKNDFGTEADPLRDLAARGLHYDPEMTPDKWARTASNSIMEDPIGYYSTPPHWSQPQDGNTGYDPVVGPQVMQAAPWLAKQPVTDNLYGIMSPLDLGHFNDELHNALNPQASGLPSELAVRPESLQRMSFPQAVEHVGRINQFRVKQMEDAAQAALNNPAIHPHKDYGDGMRWVELKQPEAGPHLLDDFDRQLIAAAHAEGRDIDPAHMAEVYAARARTPLEDALRHEGDTMGHCVGGYCNDVVSGRSRIFSLRDAKGQPHVTVETSPRSAAASYGRVEAAAPGLFDSINNNPDYHGNMKRWLTDNHPEVAERVLTPLPDDIIQIKGKQNRAPNDQYLPYVQDFVKSGQWGNVGDLKNTGLVKLPDGRYITKQQWNEGITKAVGARNPQWTPERLNQVVGDAYTAPSPLTEDRWDTDYAPHFQGYAYGGRVAADRNFAGRV